MSVVADLEARLLEDFSDTNLAAYGLELRLRGNPRGDLIEIDLARDPARRERRDKLIEHWLGPLAARYRKTLSVDRGFLIVTVSTQEDYLEDVVRHPAARFVRELQLNGWAQQIDGILRGFEVDMPWLHRVELTAYPGTAAAPIEGRALEVLARRAPNLRSLYVNGTRVLGELEHHGIRELELAGFDAVGSVLDAGPVRLPALERLDVLGQSSEDPRAIAARYRPERMPHLRTLDLSRNEPSSFLPRTDAFEILAHSPFRRVAITMPSIRTERHVEVLATALAEGATDLAVARAYAACPAAPPGVRMPVHVYTWLPVDIAPKSYTVQVGTERFELRHTTLVGHLERGVSDDQLRPWLAFFDALGGGRVVRGVSFAAWLYDLRHGRLSEPLARWRDLAQALERRLTAGDDAIVELVAVG